PARAARRRGVQSRRRRRPFPTGARYRRGAGRDPGPGGAARRRWLRARPTRPGGAGAAAMDLVGFSGPTIDAASVQARYKCICLPPAARGDIHRAALRKPRAIGLIDGYFHGVASVWHKEILWAMSQGIHVFGSSSMGALRASELHAFGMHGV